MDIGALAAMRQTRNALEHHRRGATRSVAVLAAKPRACADEDTPPTSAIDDPVDALLAELKTTLSGLRGRTDADPSSNPIQLLALAIKERMDGGVLPEAVIEQLIQRLSVEAFARRAERLRRYLGETECAANLQRLRALIHDLTRDGARARTVSFEEFRQRIARPRFGVVFTGHPTFALGRGVQQTLVELALGVTAAGRPLDAASRATLLSELAQSEHRPDQPLDLDEEHRQSLDAINNLHSALDRLCSLVLDVAREIYPERWTELNPNLVTIASWVGHDLDGRSDIPWTASMAKRLRLQALQLEHCRDEARRLRAMAEQGSALGDVLDLLDARLTLALKQAEEEIAVFGARAPTNPAAFRRELARAARAMHAGRAARLVHPGSLIELIERALTMAADPALRLELCVLRARITSFGLGLAHTHVRLNARQLHNAIRKTIGMDHPADDPSHRLTYLNAISALIERAAPAQINFGSLAAEKATAKRLFMIIAQTLKYIDASQPIRFLIAECEAGFTLLTALYFARLFGVEDKVEISPLFETRIGLERGADVIAEALAVNSFRAHVRRQGRLHIQTGFSDAGRYLGQIAAAHAIERLRIAVGRVLAERGLHDIELVIFDTHGESMGRGGHPESLADRLAYVDTPAARAGFARLGVRYRQEVSFQGGDGYLPFITPACAFTALCRMLEHTLAPPAEGDDPFYAESDYTEEFFATIEAFNRGIMDDPAYGALLGAYGTNLLYTTGSRPARRQHDTWSGQINLEHPSQLRAIPHNAILQQLGFLANVIGGVGQAVTKDPERFQRLYETSPRFRRLMTMVEHAFKYSDLAVLEAYIDLFDPGFWLRHAARRSDEPRAEELLELATVMERAALHERLKRIWRTFLRDYLALAAALREHRRRTRHAGAEPIAVDAASRDSMHQLNALRIALIQELYQLASHVPDFSDRHELTREGLLARLVQLDIDPSLAKLGEIFPMAEGDDEALDFGEPTTYESAEGQSYRQEHLLIFQPMGRLYELIRQISSAVIYNVGALG
jgi:phosphoenolpyruvate carboxylase